MYLICFYLQRITEGNGYGESPSWFRDVNSGQQNAITAACLSEGYEANSLRALLQVDDLCLMSAEIHIDRLIPCAAAD